MNKLTERLFAEGYTKDNHPYEVIWDEPWKEFRWIYYFACERTYKTPCGMLLKGSFAHNGLCFMGEEFCHENDNPYIVCPKECVGCEHRIEPMKGQNEGVLRTWCIVQPTDEEYHYEESCEAMRKLKDDQIRRDKMSFMLSKNGRVCENHMTRDEVTGWRFRYDPMYCARGFCNGSEFCPVLGKPLGKEKGNVYFDLLIQGRDYTKDGTIFEGQRFKEITKGVPLFDKPINLEIARIIAKTCHDQIRWKVENSRYVDSMKCFLASRGEIDYSFEILNVRAEKKVVRDFEQDLSDINDGVRIYHYFDEERKKKLDKSEKIQKAKEARKKAIERKILRSGWDSLDYKERIAAEKNLTDDEIEILDKRFKSQKNAPKQMSIFDFIEEGKA